MMGPEYLMFPWYRESLHPCNDDDGVRSDLESRGHSDDCGRVTELRGSYDDSDQITGPLSDQNMLL